MNDIIMDTHTPIDRATRQRCLEKDVKSMTHDELVEAMMVLEMERKAIVEQSKSYDKNVPFQKAEDVRHAA